MENHPRYSLKSVDNALRMIHQLKSGRILYVSAVAAELNVARSTAHRLLSMLVHHGFASRGASREYLPGPALREPSLGLPTGWTIADIRFRVNPHLRSLTDATGETSNVQLLIDEFTHVIASVESQRALRVGNREGQYLPAERSSGGKALNFHATPTDRVKRGPTFLAVNDQEIESGITAVGVAIQCKALPRRLAVSVVMPSSRFNPEILEVVRNPLGAAAVSIATEIDRD